jgi:hypothetical protein
MCPEGPNRPERQCHGECVDAQDIIVVRLLVGYLGERGQAAWWGSDFLSTTSKTFLTPVFGAAADVAQLAGVTEAARSVHDERIGVGRVFHLFRLPESMEQQCAGVLRHFPALQASIGHLTCREAASAALRDHAKDLAKAQEGPVRIGDISDLAGTGWLGRAATCYLAAFDQGVQSFPYFADGA